MNMLFKCYHTHTHTHTHTDTHTHTQTHTQIDSLQVINQLTCICVCMFTLHNGITLLNERTMLVVTGLMAVLIEYINYSWQDKRAWNIVHIMADTVCREVVELMPISTSLAMLLTLWT